MEQFTRTAGELRGTSVIRSPRTTVRDYVVTFTPNGRVERFRLTAGPPGGVPAQEQVLDYAEDSIRVTVRRGGQERHLAVAVKGRPLPYLEDIFGPWEQVLREAVGHPTVAVLVGRNALTYQVEKDTDGEVVLDTDNSDFGPLHARVSAGGQLQHFDMTATTAKYIVQRVPELDVTGLAAAFAQRDRAGAGLGTLSPRDTARAQVGTGHVLVDYGRPAVRGRKIFGGVVPWETVWRTGANAATQLITDVSLDLGGTTIPQGTYSLWTIPSPTGWTLIINRQHGQWGTEYDRTQDLARVDLRTRHRADPVERLTITITPRSAGGVLSFAWADTEASIPFKTR